MNRIKLALVAVLFATPALANCRIEPDHYGGGTSTMRCDDGYSVRSERDHIGGASTYFHDNKGNRGTVRKSPYGGPDEVIEFLK